MIKSDQYEVLVRLLSAALPVSSDGAELERYVGQAAAARAPTATQLRSLARWIVDEILRQPQPDRFIVLVDRLDDEQEGIASLVALADALRNGTAQWQPLGGPSMDWGIDTDPLLVAPDRPFIDRAGFRALLPRAQASDSPGILVVAGDRLQGKSYLRDFCFAFSGHRGSGMPVAYTRFPESGASDGSPRVYALEIASGLRVDMDSEPIDVPNQERDAENLASWITSYLPANELPALAIFDEFRGADVSAAQHRLIAELARTIAVEPRVRKQLRLILIDYPADRLLQAGIPFERHVLEPVEEHHIEDWLRRAFPERPPFRYENTARTVMEKIRTRLVNLPQDRPSQRMKMLDLALRTVRL